MKLRGLLLILGMVVASSTIWALPDKINTPNSGEEKMEIAETSSHAMTKAEIKEMRKEARQQRQLERKQAFYKKKLSKKMDKYGDVDFSDPVKKWMWFWIFGWAGALVLYIIAAAAFSTVSVGGAASGGIFWLLGSLVGLFGTVSLIVWLVKMAA